MDFNEIKETYINVFKEHYADFKGRARRKEYWTFALVNFVISIVLSFIDKQISVYQPLGLIFSLATLVPSITIGIRRLHDVGKSGWFVLLALIPIIGWIYLIVLTVTDSVPGENEWGKNPKGVGNIDEIDQIGKA